MDRDAALREVVPHMVVWRGFSDYRASLRPEGVDLAALVLDRARDQGEVHFYDLGCGRGRASRDFFPVLDREREEQGLPARLLDGVHYHGVELFVKPEIEVSDQVHAHYPVDLRELPAYMPPIDVGVAYFVLPYLDDKLAGMASWAASLRQGSDSHAQGSLVVTEMHSRQLRWVRQDQPMAAWEFAAELDLSSLLPLRRSLTSTVVLSGGPLTALPRYAGSSDEPTYWHRGVPKGSFAGQKISYYYR